MNQTPNPVWLLVHVPKCAGRTVENHILNQLPAEEILNPPRRKAPARYFSRPYYELPDSRDYNRVRTVIGHHFGQSVMSFFPDREIRQCVMIRDPLSYMISYYNFRMNRYRGEGRSLFPFELWYKTRPLNPISHFILNRYLEIPNTTLWRLPAQERLAILEEALSSFAFVSSLKACNDFLARLSKELDIPPAFDSINVTTNKFVTADDLSPSLRQQILEENTLDTALFEKYQDRGWSPERIGETTGILRNDRWHSLIRDISRPVYQIRARYLRGYRKPS